jgi:glycosyltransferase involved in cell wall biosynthesis
MRLSIIVNNYNYGRYVDRCIKSILPQLRDGVELIVVDDGSTDNSIAVIHELGNGFRFLAKPNGGQASAFNEGFRAAKGDWVWFIDADDWLADDAIGALLPNLLPEIVKIHFPLHAVDGNGVSLGYSIPGQPLSNGNVIPEIVRSGGYVWPPTSGNVFLRSALESFMPIPEEQYRLCADLYVCTWVVGQGAVMAITRELGYYRIHGSNAFHGFRMEQHWLRRQFDNLRNSDLLNTALVKSIGYTDFEYKFNRRNLEMLLLSQRFGAVPEGAGYKIEEILQQWKEDTEVCALRGLSKAKAWIYFQLLRYAPLSIIRSARKVMNQ